MTNLKNIFYVDKEISRYHERILSNSKRMTNTFNDFINVIKKDPKVQIKINDMLDRFNRLPYNYQLKIGYDTSIQTVILKELINIMGITITDLDIELKMKISRIEYLESRLI